MKTSIFLALICWALLLYHEHVHCDETQAITYDCKDALSMEAGNNSCNSHCILQNLGGGYCQKGILKCICEKDGVDTGTETEK